MNEFDVIGRIRELCVARSWSYYRLATDSGIPYSRLSTMLHKPYTPTVPSLTKICDGLGITLAQFFSDQDESAKLTKKQKECLSRWDKLDQHGQELALAYMDGLLDYQNTHHDK